MGAHLFSLDSQDWRSMRVKLTPTFTSGKMKMMFNSILSHSESLLKAIDSHIKNKEDIDIKDVSTKLYLNIFLNQLIVL